MFIMPAEVHECLSNRKCSSEIVANAVCRRALQQGMAIFKVFGNREHGALIPWDLQTVFLTHGKGLR